MVDPLVPRNWMLNKKMKDLHPKTQYERKSSMRTLYAFSTSKDRPAYRPRAKVTLAKVWEGKKDK